MMTNNRPLVSSIRTSFKNSNILSAMKKVISISAFLLLFAGAAWFNTACNKDTDTTATAVTPAEQVIISTEGDGVIDRGCTPCPGTRSMAGEATAYTIRILTRICPTDAWNLVGTWTQATWPIAPSYTPFPINIEHAKHYRIEVTNNSLFSAYFQNIKIYNTSLLTNFQTGVISNLASGATYIKEFTPIADCGCGWVYGCPGPGTGGH
jgi:hypothetical protein